MDAITIACLQRHYARSGAVLTTVLVFLCAVLALTVWLAVLMAGCRAILALALGALKHPIEARDSSRGDLMHRSASSTDRLDVDAVGDAPEATAVNSAADKPIATQLILRPW